jgi:hypothetical protein
MYNPFSVPTLQTEASVAARAALEEPGATMAAKHTNPQAKARELIVIFINFVFIVIISFL